MLQRVLDILPLVADQVEYHPFLAQALLRIAVERDITITAYSPLAHGKVPARPRADRDRRGARQERRPGRAALTARPAERHDVPKASSHERRLENFDVFDFELTDADRERIAALPKDVRTADPPWAPDWSD